MICKCLNFELEGIFKLESPIGTCLQNISPTLRKIHLLDKIFELSIVRSDLIDFKMPHHPRSSVVILGRGPGPEKRILVASQGLSIDESNLSQSAWL